MSSLHHCARTCLCLLLGLALGGCLQPAEERAELDGEVGRTSVAGVSFAIVGGLGAVREAEPGRIAAWTQAPTLELELRADSMPVTTVWQLELRNILPDAELVASDAATGAAVAVTLVERPLPTRGIWQLDLAAGQSLQLRLAAPDADAAEPFRYGVLSDVQSAMDEVEDVYARMNLDPALRFVVSSGDLGEQGHRSELLRFQRKLEGLGVPFYSTVGNHELGVEPGIWADLFGPFNFSFAFKSVRFTLVDSGNATIDPLVYERLDGWLEAGRGQVHNFVTHIAPIDPVGVRNGSFRSRREAGKLLGRLADGEVDLTLYGHIHSFYAFENAGIPAYISGGGGALPERIDGVERHYLVVDVDPIEGTQEVSIVRIE